MIKVLNTQSGQKEELITIVPHQVNMYVCGPTVYNYIHLGNARPMVAFDMIRRYLQFRGYQVKYVQNFTDVDDKIINRAAEEGVKPQELAELYIKEYFKDADALGVMRADIYPQASEHINDIVQAIKILVEKGFAYTLEQDVYYRVRRFKDYGKLSGRSLDDMMAGARVEVNDGKEEAADFALWKAAKAGEPSWPSPWGEGRPGWHIECSVMSTRYLGDTFDIHGGGADLVFPHHENEIAQAEALTGKPFVKYWLHNGFITVNNEKMSKSLGNFFILRDILQAFPPDVVRFYLLSTHYRSPLDFDDGKLEEARKALTRLKNTIFLAAEFTGHKPIIETRINSQTADFMEAITLKEEQFIEAMDDDFNSAKAMGYLFEISRIINSYVANADRDSTSDRYVVHKAITIFKTLGNLLGIFINQTIHVHGVSGNTETGDIFASHSSLPLALIEMLAGLRRSYRTQKLYDKADLVRDMLSRRGIIIEDTTERSRLRYDKLPSLEEIMADIIDIRSALKRDKQYEQADVLRRELLELGIILEDTREGARWKIAQT